MRARDRSECVRESADRILQQPHLTVVAKRSESAVERDLRKHVITEALRDLENVAVAVDIDALAAIGANCIAHILNEAENGNIHHIRHICRLADLTGSNLKIYFYILYTNAKINANNIIKNNIAFLW